MHLPRPERAPPGRSTRDEGHARAPAACCRFIPTTPGVYYVGVRLDPLDEITEQREDDNLTWLTHKRLYVGPRPTVAPTWLFYH